jgi:hypothetical protein
MIRVRASNLNRRLGIKQDTNLGARARQALNQVEV